ncbi:MAG: ferredoxin, partial [Actinomycetes bacterium]
MPFVIGDPCIDVTDKSCIEECPVDCIYEGARKLYIHPNECIDCGACEPVCPVSAISADRKVPEDQAQHRADNAEFFAITLPGRGEPLGAPGGAGKLGLVGADTPLV